MTAKKLSKKLLSLTLAGSITASMATALSGCGSKKMKLSRWTSIIPWQTIPDSNLDGLPIF